MDDLLIRLIYVKKSILINLNDKLITAEIL